MAGKFEVYKDKAGEFRFRLKAGNGQNILSSEGYSAKKSCMNGIESVKKNSQNPDRFEKKKTASGQVFVPPVRYKWSVHRQESVVLV